MASSRDHLTTSIFSQSTSCQRSRLEPNPDVCLASNSCCVAVSSRFICYRTYRVAETHPYTRLSPRKTSIRRTIGCVRRQITGESMPSRGTLTALMFDAAFLPSSMSDAARSVSRSPDLCGLRTRLVMFTGLQNIATYFAVVQATTFFKTFNAASGAVPLPR